ncbi:MAG: alcohol dehydrogenase catalytic domain-containing protein, partial [Candidatus Hydrogenedentes bacterium]|nr:alcohol dehydrogenase catalytic domain-containing protein [Candidatus Hydrogenedentota bacterium]
GFSGVLGHEFVGIVEEASSEHLRGKRVVGEINCTCHRCEYCALEMPRHCLNRSVIGILNRDGAFAEYIALPEENLHVVPPVIRDNAAVFTEPLAAAFRILEQVNITGEDRVIVLGDGKLGQLIAQVVGGVTRNLVCVGKHGWKLEMFQKLSVATALINDPMERGADFVVEATGTNEGFASALELVRPEGAVILKTTIARPAALDMSLPVINEVNIVGSRCGPFRPALEALSKMNVDVHRMVTETFELQDGLRALRRASDPDAMKILLHM